MASRHVTVCPFPLASHPATLLLLARKIAAAAPGVHFTFFATAALPSPPEPNVAVHHIAAASASAEGKAATPGERLRAFLEGAGESLRRSMAAAEEEVGVKISAVVADALLAAVCGEIAAEKGVKWVALWTSGAASLAAHVYTDVLRSCVGDKGVEAILEDTADHYIVGFPPIPLADLPNEVLKEDLSTPGANLLHRMALALHAATAVAVNSFFRLEPTISVALNLVFQGNLLHIGPFPLTLPSYDDRDVHHCLPWLDTRPPTSVVYISFGTANTPPPVEIAALAAALEAADVAFLWSLPDHATPALPDGFVARVAASEVGMVVPWAPQMRVLRHVAVGAHLTHCGWNSILESVVTGVPMVCRPFLFAEQTLNKKLVESIWEIGVAVEGGRLTEVAAMKAMEKVVAGGQLTEAAATRAVVAWEERKGMRERIRELKSLAEEDAQNGSTVDFERLVKIVTT